MYKKIPRKKIKKKLEIDINELQKDLEDLKKYIEEVTLFFPLAFCIVNPFHLIVGVNQAFKDLTGYDEIELTGRDIAFLFGSKKQVEDFKKIITGARQRINRELILLTKEGKRIPVSISSLTRTSEEGDFQGYFLTLSDISETKKFQEKLEKEVKEKTKELQEKVAELESFNKLAIGRELKMVELKKEIEKLKKGQDSSKDVGQQE